MSNFYTLTKLTLGGILILLSLSCSSAQESPSSVFDVVKERGHLICGIEGNLPGLSEPLPPGRSLRPFDSFDTDYGDFKGFDIDFCRAIAVAMALIIVSATHSTNPHGHKCPCYQIAPHKWGF